MGCSRVKESAPYKNLMIFGNIDGGFSLAPIRKRVENLPTRRRFSNGSAKSHHVEKGGRKKKEEEQKLSNGGPSEPSCAIHGFVGGPPASLVSSSACRLELVLLNSVVPTEHSSRRVCSVSFFLTKLDSCSCP
ncbi:hypothetical protein NL676_000814 [Syzygium grande]|nr:hypothetical protein NL676_000814 [Syzygium grande]